MLVEQGILYACLAEGFAHGLLALDWAIPGKLAEVKALGNIVRIRE